MAYKLVEYYKVKSWAADYLADSSMVDGTDVTFTSTDNAKTTIGFSAIFDTGSPTKTYELTDTNTTLKVTYTFGNKGTMTSFTSAVGTDWTNNGAPFTGTSNPYQANGKEVRLVKQEHLGYNDAVVTTLNHPM